MMDTLMMGVRDLVGFHADLVVQTAVWVALWAVGLWVLRVRAGALQYAAWLIALGAIPLFPLIGGPVSRIVRMTDMVPVFTIPRIVPVPDVQPVSPADRSEAQKSEVRGPEVRGQGRVEHSTEVSLEARKRSIFDALPSLSRSNLLAMIGSVWLAGVLVMLLRMMLSYRALLRICRRTRVVSDSRLRSMLEALRKEIRIGRFVHLEESDDISSPISYGWRRPVILLPSSLLGSMPRSEIRGVLAHELAHIRRLDFVVMLFQRILEAFFFYHPMVWFASGRLTLNREHACDDWVLSLGSHRKEYAMSLIGFMKQVVSEAEFVSALFGHPGKLAQRIALIAKVDRKVAPSASRGAVAVTVLVAMLGLLGIGLFSCVSHESLETQPATELPEQYLYVIIYENGKMELDQQPVTFDELKEELIKQRKAGVRTVVIISDKTSLKSLQDTLLKPEQYLYLIIDENGKMELNQQPVTFATLKEEMAKQRKWLNDTKVIVVQVPDLSPGKNIFRNQVIRVMNIAKQIGVTDLVVATKPSQGR